MPLTCGTRPSSANRAAQSAADEVAMGQPQQQFGRALVLARDDQQLGRQTLVLRPATVEQCVCPAARQHGTFRR